MTTPPLPQRVPLTSLGRPREAEPFLELRFTNGDGRTEVWYIERDSFKLDQIASGGEVRLAYIDNGVDSRLAIQLNSINRLLDKTNALQDHVNFHHAGLKGVFPCGFEGKGGADAPPEA